MADNASRRPGALFLKSEYMFLSKKPFKRPGEGEDEEEDRQLMQRTSTSAVLLGRQDLARADGDGNPDLSKRCGS